MKAIEDFSWMGVYHNNWKLNYLLARFYSLILFAGCLEIENEKVFNRRLDVFRGKMKRNWVDLRFRIGGFVLTDQLYADVTDISNIIDSTMMPALVF